MNFYLITFKGHGKFVNGNTNNICEAIHEFEEKHGKEKYEYSDCYNVYHDQVENGVLYDEELSYNGCRFLLFKLPGVTREQINKTKKLLKSKRDVVSMKVSEIKDYVGEIPWHVKENLRFGAG